MAPATAFLNVKRAFGHVSHPHSLFKGRTLDIIGLVVTLFILHISQRSLVLLLNGHVSQTRLVISKVIQGSVPGTHLIFMHINIILIVISIDTLLLSADNIETVCTSKHNQ